MIRPDDAALYAERLARRLPAWDQRRRVASDAGLGDAQIAGDPITSWRLLITESDARDLWPELATAAAKAAPDDPALAGIALAANKGEAWRPEGWFGWLLGATATMGATAVAVVLGTFLLAVLAVPRLLPAPTGSAPGVPAASVSVAPAAPGVEAPAAPTAPVAAAPPPPVAPPPAPVAAPVVPAPVVPAAKAPAVEIPAPVAPAKAPKPEPAAPKPPEPPAKPRRGDPAAIAAPVGGGGCVGVAALPDGTIGWGYAGKAAPEVKAGRWRPEGSVNLRTAPPSKETAWKPGGSRCTVLPGTVLVVDPPVFVPRDSWWVPVRRVGGAP